MVPRHIAIDSGPGVHDRDNMDITIMDDLEKGFKNVRHDVVLMFRVSLHPNLSWHWPCTRVEEGSMWECFLLVVLVGVPWP